MLRKLLYPFTFVWVVLTEILSGLHWVMDKSYPAFITAGAISLVIYFIAAAFSSSWAPGYPDFRWYAIIFCYSWIPCIILLIFYLIAEYRHKISEAFSKWFETTKQRTDRILQAERTNPASLEVLPGPRPKPKPPQQQRGRFE